MKTAKELLFQKHAAAEAKLEQLQMPSSAPKILRVNWNLAALAALWMTIAFFSFSSPATENERATTKPAASNPVASLESRRTEILRLLESLDTPVIVSTSKSAYLQQEFNVV